jgi:hypothetical protein
MFWFHFTKHLKSWGWVGCYETTTNKHKNSDLFDAFLFSQFSSLLMCHIFTCTNFPGANVLKIKNMTYQQILRCTVLLSTKFAMHNLTLHKLSNAQYYLVGSFCCTILLCTNFPLHSPTLPTASVHKLPVAQSYFVQSFFCTILLCTIFPLHNLTILSTKFPLQNPTLHTVSFAQSFFCTNFLLHNLTLLKVSAAQPDFAQALRCTSLRSTNVSM